MEKGVKRNTERDISLVQHVHIEALYTIKPQDPHHWPNGVLTMYGFVCIVIYYVYNCCFNAIA